jgi:hypothetical protein
MLWVIQHLREATTYGTQPRYIIRDNDKIYGSGVPNFLKNSGIREVCQSALKNDPVSALKMTHLLEISGRSRMWVKVGRRSCPQMGHRCTPIHNHIIPLNEQHLHKLLREYVDSYYHPVRTHSSLDHKPPSANLSIKKRQLSPDTTLESERILGGLYHNYRAKAA